MIIFVGRAPRTNVLGMRFGSGIRLRGLRDPGSAPCLLTSDHAMTYVRRTLARAPAQSVPNDALPTGCSGHRISQSMFGNWKANQFKNLEHNRVNYRVKLLARIGERGAKSWGDGAAVCTESTLRGHSQHGHPFWESEFGHRHDSVVRLNTAPRF